MAAPVFGASTLLTAATAASVAVAVPSGVAADTVIIVHIYKENTASVTSVPSGFTEITPAAQTTGTIIDHRTFWKRATGADTGTYSFSWTGSTWCQAAATSYTGCVTSGSPVDDSSTGSRSSNGTVTPTVAVTTTGIDRMLVWAGTDNSSGTWSALTAGLTLRTSGTTWLAVGSGAQTAAGASGSKTGTCATSSFQTATLLALLPVSSAQTVSPSGIATAEAFGTAVLSATVTISPSGIASSEAFGTALVNDGVVHPVGIASAQAFGAATITTGPTSIFPTGIASAQVFGTPAVTITFDLTKLPAVPRRAVGYELVCVSRINAPSGPPSFFEVDPIQWKGLSWVDELSRPSQLNASVKIDTLTDAVIQRLTHLDELGTELWLYRDGRLVHAGPWENWTTQGDTMTFVSRGLLGYLDYWAVTADLVFAGVDQFAIAKGLIDQWQNTIPFGNFGIDTSAVGGSGVTRDATYKAVELHNIGQRVRELGTRLNGFDIAVDPSTRALTLGYPQLGVDRSTGPDAIVFDSLNITNVNIGCAVGPGDIASEAIGTGTGTAGPLISTRSNLDLRARFGATAVTQNFDGVSEQSTLDDHTQGLLDARGDALLIPGPGVRSTLDADIGAYSVGDTVAYELHQRLGLSGAFRLRKRTVTVSATGVEKATFEFV